jgi:hypothetical protein
LCIFFDSVAMSISGSCIWVASPVYAVDERMLPDNMLCEYNCFFCVAMSTTQPCA